MALEIVYAGTGKVGERCREIIDEMEISYILFQDWDGSDKDLLLSVHWPHIFRTRVLTRFREGCLNLHNAYLPWNRGAHACSWAILDGTPHGASLHWIDEGLDTGDIFYQEQLTILPTDTADSLYQRTADLEVEVFKHGMKFFLEGDRTRIPQTGRGSFHNKKDLELMKRALTTNDLRVVSRGEEVHHA